MNTQIYFPQGPITDGNDHVTLEWRQWFQNLQILTGLIAGNLTVNGTLTVNGQIVGAAPSSGWYFPQDGQDGMDGVPGVQGITGATGPQGFTIVGQDGEDGPPGIPGAWGNNSAPTLAGVYTPTLTNVANLDASTAYECQYIQVGTTVAVSGRVDVDPTAPAASTQLGVSLPIASNFGTTQDCGGCAFASGIAGQGAAMLADVTNDRAQMQWVSADVTNQAMYFTLQYQLI